MKCDDFQNNETPDLFEKRIKTYQMLWLRSVIDVQTGKSAWDS